jgi:excisionase family DNA binding protein
MLTLSQAAEELGITAATLRQQIHAGQLAAEKIGPMWVISDTALATYRLNNHGRIGRPFVGRPGYVDTRHIRIRLLFAPADGRGHNAIWLQYLRQNFVFDLDFTHPKPFRWTSEAFQPMTPETANPGGRVIELWNREHLAREMGGRKQDVDVLLRVDPTFPLPVIAFHDGPVWDATAMERWWAARDATKGT